MSTGLAKDLADQPRILRSANQSRDLPVSGYRPWGNDVDNIEDVGYQLLVNLCHGNHQPFGKQT